MSALETRLTALGVTLPSAPAPAANYVPFVQVGSLVHISGQISRDAAGGLILGKLGATLDAAQGAEAAKTCAIALLAQLKAACGGDLDRAVRAVKLTGFVNSTADFTDQPKVINGASDFLVAVMGDAGRHARSAVSAASLPFGVAVEIEGIFEIAPPKAAG
jgi:enamine deaminase RidA (YjgF/YER057c/UK114 family)